MKIKNTILIIVFITINIFIVYKSLPLFSLSNTVIFFGISFFCIVNINSIYNHFFLIKKIDINFDVILLISVCIITTIILLYIMPMESFLMTLAIITTIFTFILNASNIFRHFQKK